jgi:hypothetical protein
MKKIKLTAKIKTIKTGLVTPDRVSASPENGGVELEQRALDDGFSKGALNVFVFVICGLFVAFAVGLMMDPLGTQRYIFFNGTRDFLADFFNVLHFIAERDQYFNAFTSTYFPLACMILYPFSKLDNFSTMSLYEMWGSRIGLLSYFFLTGFFVFLLFMSLYQIAKKYSVSQYILISLVLSYILIYTVERGNLILLSAACIGFFICNYDSENKHKRTWAAIFLALAINLKVFPVLFGILYFAKKQYRELFFCAIIAWVLAFVPFLFLKSGVTNIPQLIINLHHLGDTFTYYRLEPKYSLAHVTYVCSLLLNVPGEIIHTLSSAAKIINTIMCVVSVGFSCVEKNKWLKISLLTMTLIFLPNLSQIYCGLYVFPMIILFFATTRERAKSFNIFILVIFIVFLNPLQLAIIPRTRYSADSVNYLIGNVALFSLHLALLIYVGRRITMNCIASILPKRTLLTR